VPFLCLRIIATVSLCILFMPVLLEWCVLRYLTCGIVLLLQGPGH
jgi:hypothetical protein